MAHVSLRKIVLASAVAGVIALMSLGTVGCAPKTADLSETGSGSQAEADENAAMTGDFAFSADADCTTCHSTEGDSLGDATMRRRSAPPAIATSTAWRPPTMACSSATRRPNG